MSTCVRENTAQHYLGQWGGFGTVNNDEEVIFAVFATTPVNGSKLDHTAFEPKQLKRNNLSLARGQFTSRRTFFNKVVTPQKGALTGISVADVSILRQMRADIKLGAETKNVRSICVLDCVERSDFDGHAAVGYCEDIDAALAGVSLPSREKMLKTIRRKIGLDLASAFSDVTHHSSKSWPSSIEVLRSRLWSLCRVLKAELRSIVPTGVRS
jgi:hypothetical protein